MYWCDDAIVFVLGFLAERNAAAALKEISDRFPPREEISDFRIFVGDPWLVGFTHTLKGPSGPGFWARAHLPIATVSVA